MYALYKVHSFYFKCEPLIKTFNYSPDFFRHVRNASKRNVVLKTIKDFKVKNSSDLEDFYNTVDYDDLSRRIKENDLEIEETFTKGEDLDTVVSESGRIYNMHINEKNRQRSFVKKKLIGRKYFKLLEKETNLLTHAAKEQIRFLHNSDPIEWTPAAIAQSFPISINGAKKLLRSNFVMSAPERIKEHDEDVKRKWDILNSGEKSEAISFYTWKLWDEGKLLKENYNGSPSLPKSSKPHRTIEEITVKNQKPLGEHAAIVQNYVEYKTHKDSIQKNNSELTIGSENVRNKTKSAKYDDETQKVRKISKYLRDDGSVSSKVKQLDETELPFSQFKENMKQDLNFKSKKSSTHKQYYEWIEQDSKEKDHRNSVRPYNTDEFVSKISKYDKNRRIEIQQDKSNNSFYVYDEKLGYQNLKGQNIKSKIRISNTLQKKNTLYKVGQCVYDEDGEFLYKVPS